MRRFLEGGRGRPGTNILKKPGAPKSWEGFRLGRVAESDGRVAKIEVSVFWNHFGPTPETIPSEQVGVSSTREATF